jgi:hypothetical protein
MVGNRRRILKVSDFQAFNNAHVTSSLPSCQCLAQELSDERISAVLAGSVYSTSVSTGPEFSSSELV